MSGTLTYQQMGTAAGGQTHALFAQTTGYAAGTAGLFAVGARARRDLAGGVGIVAFIAAFACLIGTAAFVTAAAVSGGETDG